MKPTSKVIQISTTNVLGVEGVHPDYFVLTALCEDGSIWEKVDNKECNCVLQAF